MKPHIQRPPPRAHGPIHDRTMLVTTKKKGFLFVNLISKDDTTADDQLALLAHYQDQCETNPEPVLPKRSTVPTSYTNAAANRILPSSKTKLAQVAHHSPKNDVPLRPSQQQSSPHATNSVKSAAPLNTKVGSQQLPTAPIVRPAPKIISASPYAPKFVPQTKALARSVIRHADPTTIPIPDVPIFGRPSNAEYHTSPNRLTSAGHSSMASHQHNDSQEFIVVEVQTPHDETVYLSPERSTKHFDGAHIHNTPPPLERTDFQSGQSSDMSPSSPTNDITLDCWRHRRKMLQAMHAAAVHSEAPSHNVTHLFSAIHNLSAIDVAQQYTPSDTSSAARVLKPSHLSSPHQSPCPMDTSPDQGPSPSPLPSPQSAMKKQSEEERGTLAHPINRGTSSDRYHLDAKTSESIIIDRYGAMTESDEDVSTSSALSSDRRSSSQKKTTPPTHSPISTRLLPTGPAMTPSRTLNFVTTPHDETMPLRGADVPPLAKAIVSDYHYTAPPPLFPSTKGPAGYSMGATTCMASQPMGLSGNASVSTKGLRVVPPHSDYQRGSGSWRASLTSAGGRPMSSRSNPYSSNARIDCLASLSPAEIPSSIVVSGGRGGDLIHQNEDHVPDVLCVPEERRLIFDALLGCYYDEVAGEYIL